MNKAYLWEKLGYVVQKGLLDPAVREVMLNPDGQLWFQHQTNGIEGRVFCDLFAGTATVGHYFNQLGFKVISNDFLYASYVMQQVKLKIDRMPSFKRIARHLGFKINKKNCYAESVIDYLNQLNGIEGFIYRNYTE